MPRIGIDKDTVIRRAAQMANEIGFENVTLKVLADDLGIKSPSLYNHIGGLEDVKRQIMIYGWKQMEECIRTLRGFLEGFALLVNNKAFGNPIAIEESFELSVHVLIEGIKTLEDKNE